MIGNRMTMSRVQGMTPDEAAAWWLVSDDAERAKPEQEVFEEWLYASPENQDAWRRAKAAWDSFDNAADDEVLQDLRAAALSAGPDHSRIRLRLAASFIGVAALASALLVSDLPFTGDASRSEQSFVVASKDPHKTFGKADYATATGQMVSLSLPDGSLLTLDTDSAVDLNFGAQRRLRLLKGQAHFDVVSDSSRPFSVQANGLVITALGTKFTVRAGSSQLRVALLEGKVTVGAQDDATSLIELSPGQQFVSRGKSASVSSIDLLQADAWRRGYVYFENQTVAYAAEELNRYTDKKLIVHDPQVALLPISGRFRTGDMPRFARALTGLHPVRVIEAANGNLEVVTSAH